MPFTLMELPFERDALEPYMSSSTVDFHYGKHHKAYVDKLNKLIEGTDIDKMSLSGIIRRNYEPGRLKQNDLFNNAAQVWNHDFFWHSMCPPLSMSHDIGSGLHRRIETDFGSFKALRELFIEESRKEFGSGWVWLTVNHSGELGIKRTHDAANLVTEKHEFPLLVCDVWEHAYYLDYQNRRPAFTASFIVDLANWEFAEKNLDKALNSA